MEEEVEPVASTVLVVDDNEANRMLAQHALEDEGYRVVLAASGAEGLAAFERELPDCVLLDVRMPEMDGFVVCERIRSLPLGTETPVLFLTALRDVDTFDRALRAGGDDFLTKPLRPTELIVRVQSALKLRRLSAELREHYALLKRQRDEMLRLQLQKERLTAFVVHDLKNPVNTMDLHAQILQRSPVLPAGLKSSVAAIRTEARHLARMISNLLDISKADEGQLAPKLADIELSGLVTDVLSELEVNARDRQVGLRSSVEGQSLYADRELVQRVVANLVENAIRHAPPATTVMVTAAELEGGTEVRVSDAGTGIAPDMREKIFEAFVQVEPDNQRSGARGSRGLGLRFCKLVAEVHGGRIWVEDAEPGALFRVLFPRRP